MIQVPACDGRTDGRTDGWTDGRTAVYLVCDLHSYAVLVRIKTRSIL